MVQKISAFGVGFLLGLIFFAPRGRFSRRWEVFDGVENTSVEDFYTRRGAQEYAAELNDDAMLFGWRSRYWTLHKSYTKG